MSKNSIFIFGKKTLKQNRGTAICTNFHLRIVFYLWKNFIDVMKESEYMYSVFMVEVHWRNIFLMGTW